MWIALTVSYVGSFVQDIGERWLILDLTTTALPSAMLSTAFVLASLVAMLPAGFLADRRDRRVLVALSQIAQAVPAAVIAVSSWTGRVTPGALLAASTAMGLGMALGSPAWNALVLDIVPRELVPDAIALAAISFNVARAVGPAIGGVVLAELGAPATFGLNAASFLVVVGAIVVWPPPRRVAPPDEAPSEHAAGARGAATVATAASAPRRSPCSSSRSARRWSTRSRPRTERRRSRRARAATAS
jgi:MFS family permease